MYIFQLLDLETRLLNVSFEDPNELWSALFEGEIPEFEPLIKIEKRNNEDLKRFIAIYKTPCFDRHHSLLNWILFETARVFVTICENMRNNEIVKEADAAIESGIEYVKINWLPQDKQTLSASTLAGVSTSQESGVEMKTRRPKPIKKQCTSVLEEARILFIAGKKCKVYIIEIVQLNIITFASPCVHFNVTSVIYVCAYITFYYFGNYFNCAEKATHIDWLPQGKQTLAALREAGVSILQGSSLNKNCRYPRHSPNIARRRKPVEKEYTSVLEKARILFIMGKKRQGRCLATIYLKI
ncbi:hypothetical protein DBV15_10595 [Temnothorax longispinosus]|uniref:Uncharacterized protein n=1 Tax=Temnothorax longispinosus TaxID=300112 RepID=A0A4S2JMJ3_9HYME|nr:hypothetical protein DBV15_10595 [Temnothorax longispinosus]